jgi:hypothetical protein
MKHFTTEEYIDFVNQVISLRRNQERRKHLEQGCKRCARAVWLWHRVGRIAKAEAKLEPPQDAVRIAKTAFAAFYFGGKAGQRHSGRTALRQVFTAGSRNCSRQMLSR